MFNKPVYSEIQNCILLHTRPLAFLLVCFVYDIFLLCCLSVHILFNLLDCQLTKCFDVQL